MRNVRRLTFIAAALIVVFHAGSAVADEPLVTDRPDFTESSSSVGRGVLQLEAGATYVDFEGGTRVATLGEVLLRWGIVERLELRFLLPTYAWEDGRGYDASGFVDTGIGLKYQFKDPRGAGIIGGMEAAVIASTTLPTASGDFESSQLQPGAVASLGWDLSRDLGLGMNFGIASPVDGDDRFTSLWISAALGIGLTDTTSVFVELFGFDREEDRGPNTLTFQTGATYLLSDDLQLDLRAARRLSDSGPDLLLGAGVSMRWGHGQ
jgi:hypothetical protein